MSRPRRPRTAATLSSAPSKGARGGVPSAARRAPQDDSQAPGVRSAALRAALGASHPFDLAAPSGPGLLDAILDVVGADTLTLRATLALWQREQDRLTNRAWRRPGGLARPGGL